ncbi:MAG TPA: carboxymuconolactone decarboxylase family protein [Gemmatimonadales bacterium]|nr:carboxymuconolactone decarboxylase family protein [Gemmatimonadales bacterium]
MGRYVAGATTLDVRLRLLVQQLAAELAGCHWCVEQGHHRWRQAFLPVDELRALSRYATSPLFGARERAALAFAEALAGYSDAAGGVSGAVLAELRRHFSEPEVAALTVAATAEHAFNAATGALGADAWVGVALGAARRASGSAMRNLW